MIGIIPAAGKAERFGGLPKFLLPVPEGHLIGVHCARMKRAGCDQVFIGSSKENLDILDQFTDNFVYIAEDYSTMSATVLSSLEILIDPDEPFDDDCILSMPDTYFEDARTFQRLSNALANGAMVAAALFHARPEQTHKLGMCDVCEYDDEWRITRVVDKPVQTTLTHAWGALAWTPDFWKFIAPEDPHVGYALQRAVAAGVDARPVFMDGGYWDCGTPDEYFALIRHLTGEPVHG